MLTKIVRSIRKVADYGLSIMWMLVMLGTAVSFYVAKSDPNFYVSYTTIIKLAVIALSVVIAGMLALFYFDAWADTLEGHPRPDVTVERFIYVIGTVVLVLGTTADMISRLNEPPSFRIPIYLFGYLILIYGTMKRRQHYMHPLFEVKSKPEDEKPV